MNRRATWYPPLLMCALALSACYPKAGPAPAALSEAALASAQTRFPGENAETLARGRQLFLDNCEVCHAYPDLWFYGADLWPKVMKRMGPNADLSAQDSDVVLHFILGAKADPKPAAAPAPAPKK